MKYIKLDELISIIDMNIKSYTETINSSPNIGTVKDGGVLGMKIALLNLKRDIIGKYPIVNIVEAEDI